MRHDIARLCQTNSKQTLHKASLCLIALVFLYARNGELLQMQTLLLKITKLVNNRKMHFSCRTMTKNVCPLSNDTQKHLKFPCLELTAHVTSVCHALAQTKKCASEENLVSLKQANRPPKTNLAHLQETHELMIV